MVKPVFRRKSIGTKVSEEEYARLEALAGGRALGEWVREVLLREVDGRRRGRGNRAGGSPGAAHDPAQCVLQAGPGRELTEEGMQAIIDRADASKLQKAVERLTGKTQQLKKTASALRSRRRQGCSTADAARCVRP